MPNAAKTAQYRARQFFSALKPMVSGEDMDLVKSVLGENSPAMALFLRMNAADQQHAIAVLQTLRNQGETHPALQQAALLHDAGKAMGQSLFHRVAIVLLQALWPGALLKLTDAPLTCPVWRRPFVVHAQHPQIGATWAKEAGCDLMTVALIEGHQEKPAPQPNDLDVFQMSRKAPQAGGLGGRPPILLSSSNSNETYPNDLMDELRKSLYEADGAN